MTADTHWLDAEEEQLWRALLAAMRSFNRGMEISVSSAAGISMADFSVLMLLADAPGNQLRLCDLCAQLRWDRSRGSHQVTRMARRGVVDKVNCGKDGRGVAVAMTELGRERLNHAIPRHIECVRRMVFDHLDPTQSPALLAFLEGMITAASFPGSPGFAADRPRDSTGRRPLPSTLRRRDAR